MDSLIGEIDREYGIKIDILPKGYLTIFLLNAKGKKYPVFFDEKVILPYGKTVVAKGELSPSTKARTSFKENKPASLKEKLIEEKLRDIMTQVRTAVGKEDKGALEGRYMKATEILDKEQNILYSIKI